MNNAYKSFSLLMLACLFVVSGCSNRKKAVEHYVNAVELETTAQQDQAIIELQEAVRLKDDFALAHSLLGDLYRQEGRYEEAIGAYKRATELDPWSFSDHFYLGKVYKILKRFSEAIVALKRACNLKPDDVQANYILSVCYYETKQYDQAAVYCRKASELDPQNEEILHSLGDIYSKTGDQEQAVNAYKQALEIDPDQPKVMIQMGKAYIRLGQLSPGHLILEKALKLAPDDVDANYTLGFCLLKEEKLGLALEQFRKTLLLDKKNYEALNGIGVTYMMFYLEDKTDSESLENALDHWQQSLEVNPDQPKIKTLLERYGQEKTTVQKTTKQ